MFLLRGLNNRLFVNTSFLFLMNDNILDIVQETLQVFVGIIFLLESFDAGTVWQNCQELKHRFIRVSEELLYVCSWRILIDVHYSELEVFFSKFGGQTIKIGFRPVALGTVLLCEHKNETFHCAWLSILAFLDKRNKVGSVNSEDRVSNNWCRVACLSL